MARSGCCARPKPLPHQRGGAGIGHRPGIAVRPCARSVWGVNGDLVFAPGQNRSYGGARLTKGAGSAKLPIEIVWVGRTYRMVEASDAAGAAGWAIV